MSNFKKYILDSVGDETILGVQIVEKISQWRPDPRDAGIEFGKLYTWEEAAPLLDYECSHGYGGQDCHSFYVWTANYVYYVHEYDGSTSIESVPRNPTGK